MFDSCRKSIRITIWVVAAVLATESADANYLQIGFGTKHLGVNPDGMQRWEIIMTNLTEIASTDYAIHTLEVHTLALQATGEANQSGVRWNLLSLENQKPNPSDNFFELETWNPDGMVYPVAFDDIYYSFCIMKINFTTPSNYNTLAEGIITAYSESAGQIDVTGLLPTATTTNGTLVTWLWDHGFTNDFDTADGLDPDSDSFKTWQEYIAGTDPTNSASFFQCAVSDAPPTLSWIWATNRVYSIYSTTSLTNGFALLTNHITSNTFRTLHTNSSAFFRIEVEVAP